MSRSSWFRCQTTTTLYDQVDKVGEILLTDWGKLQLAYQNSLTAWTWTDDSTSFGADMIQAAMEKEVHKSLLPLAFDLFSLTDQGGPDARGYVCQNKAIIGNNGGAHPGGPFYPFANEPNGGWNLIYGAGPASTVWALGNTNEEFLDIDPDKRDDTSGVPSQNLFNNIFVNDVSGRVKQPPWPGQLSFYLNTYDTQVQVTSHGGTDFCLLDRKPPPD